MKKEFWFGIIFLLSLSVNSQSKIDFDKIVPTTPESAHLQKEVAIPVDQATGVTSVSIPLFELKTGNISIPISISYHASGIRVGQLSSSVGLGWGLNAGGGLQRTIRARPDDGPQGWLYNNYTTYFADSMNQLQTMGANDYMLENLDFSQDDYSYNFLDYGGSFFFDSTKVIRNVEKGPVLVECVYPGGFRFTAKDISGYKYYFDSTDYSASTSFPSNNPVNTSLSGGISAWKLTQIKYQGVDSVKFDYEKYTVQYDENGADVYDMNQGFADCVPATQGCQTCGDEYQTALYHMITMRYFESSLVKQITSRDTKIDFFYSNNTNAVVWKRKLDSIQVTSLLDNSVVKKIYFIYSLFPENNQFKLTSVRKVDMLTGGFDETKFQYYESNTAPLPGINSKAKDMFGYFNNASNTSLIVTDDPAYTNVFANADRSINASTIMLGTLKTVVYSTGGYSEFIYEPNKVTESVFAPGIRTKEVREYNAVNGDLSKTTYEFYNFHGQSLSFPYYMDPDVQVATYHRRFFSSDEPNNYSIPLGVLPAGYVYDSVIVKTKSAAYDLLSTFKYDYFIVYNGYKSYPRETVVYAYDAGTSSYQIAKKEKSVFTHFIDYTHITPLLGVERPSLQLVAAFANSVVVTCKNVTAGLYLQYSYVENSILKTKEQSITYQGNNTLTTETRYYYANTEHNLPTRIVSLNSTDSVITTIKYPAEMVSSGLDPSGIYQGMVTSHFWGPPIIEETLDAQSNSLSKNITEYGTWTGLTAPAILKTGVKGNTPEIRKEIDSYDAYGNIEDYIQDDMHVSFLWGYNGTVPVAKIANASILDVAYSSFETTQSKWSIYGGTYSSTYSITGKKSFVLASTDSIKKTGLGGNYIISYWSRNGSMSVNGATATAGVSKNGWTYYEHKVNNASSVKLSGVGTIDELRLYPQTALMTTYTYEPIKGVSAIADANNNINYYTYDGQGRLSLVKDMDGNILKRINYSLTQSGSPTIYYNEAILGQYTKQGCGAGYVGSLVTYTVPAGRYASSISQSDANAQATLEVANLGQAYANENGTCTPISVCIPTCKAPSRRCINGVCVLGAKVYTSSTYNSGTGYYDCYYHYEWSDGFQSAEIYEQSATACM